MIALPTLSRRPWDQWAVVAVAVLVPMLLAAFLGMVIALGSPQLTLIGIAAVFGIGLLFVPTALLVQLALFIGVCGVGVLMYYAHILQAHWLLYALCAFLWIKIPIDALAQREQRREQAGLPALGVCLLLLFLVALISTLINATPLVYTLVAARNYLFIWSVAFVVAAGSLSPDQLRRCFLLVLWVVASQLIFATQQHFMNFAAGASWDSVVGSYGGDPEGGGASGSMALFAAFGMGLAIALWNHGQLSGRVALAVLLAATGSIMLAEVKAFFIFAPLMTGVVLLREMRRRPAWALAMMMLTALLLGGTLTYYRMAYFNGKGAAPASASLGDYYQYTISADSKLTDNVNHVTGEVSRLGAPLIWVQEGGFGGPHGRWVGYGMRASRSSPTLGRGDAARHFVFSLTTSTLTAVLWDLGGLGLCVLVALLVLGGLASWRLSRDKRIPPFHRAALEASAGAFLLALASLPYNDALVDGHAVQVFYSFTVGYVMYWQRWVRRAPLRA